MKCYERSTLGGISQINAETKEGQFKSRDSKERLK